MRYERQTEPTSAPGRPHPDVGTTQRDGFIAASIAAGLAKKTVCLDCLSLQAMLPRRAAEELLRSLGCTVRVTGETGTCAMCAAVRLVYTIG